MTIQEYAEDLLFNCVKNNIHDLYFLPNKEGYQLRYRTAENRRQGELLETTFGEKLILHFKFRAGMNVGEKRRAQLGAYSLELGGKECRFRLSTVGDYEGRETLVIRFLYEATQQHTSFFYPDQYEEIKKRTQKRGLFLFSGPTGSGKTTLLYRLARELGQSRQIIAIEDPVEIHEEAILQLQVNHAIEMDYERLIKLCLRHRPDLLIIGEIRDSPTARAAIRATLTGHTVFATLHAKDIEGAYMRLLELGVDKGELRECLNGITYQRIFEDVNGRHQALIDMGFLEKGELKHDKKNWSMLLSQLYESRQISKQTYYKEKT